ncbi:MAG: serine/threonine protein kinase [Planctomycetes bacterium]|nr:serine/threonine protein kinase [Planctomycetota bacterium]
MTESQWERIDRLFAAARAMPAAERERFLAAECAEQPELRFEVESLLAAEDRAGGFLQHAALGSDFDVDAVEQRSEAREVGRRCGIYRLTALIDAGGMGAVFAAVRPDDADRRRVAVKLLRDRAVTGKALERFLREREAMARLDHPNIAQLLDGGTAADGQPFLVMEFIDGERIDRWCDLHRLPIDDRLRLFLGVCEAVHHAHQNLLVHRDIKPANILVTDVGGTPVAKLLDFGIAKSMQPEGKLTQTDQKLLTPQYASPEQLLGHRITTATDIYSLGVVLYELLSGCRPFRRDAADRDLARRIGEQDPIRPSATIARPEPPPDGREPAAIAADRGLSVERLQRKLEGDLDRIVLMAMHSEPARRYASARQLATDLRQHLAGRAVLAHGDSLAYRLRKVLRRHAGALAGILLAVIAVTLGIAWRVNEVEAATRRQQVLRQQLVMLEQQESGSAAFAAALLDVRALLDELPGQTEERLWAVEQIAHIFASRSRHGEATDWLRTAVELHRDIDRSNAPGIAAAELQLTRSLVLGGRFAAAIATARGVLDRPRPLVTAAQRGTAHRLLGAAHAGLGQFAAAEAAFGQALELLQRASPTQPAELAQALADQALMDVDRGASHRAVRLLERALDVLRQTSYGQQRVRLEALVERRLGNALWMSPDFAAAEGHLRRSAALLYPRFPREDLQLCTTRLDLAVVMGHRDASGAWKSTYRECLRHIVRATGSRSVLFARACFAVCRGKPTLALELASTAHRSFLAYEALPDADPLYQTELHVLQALGARPRNRPPNAKLEMLLDDMAALVPANHPRLAIMRGLVGMELLGRKSGRARAQLEAAYTGCLATLGGEHPATVRARDNLATADGQASPKTETGWPYAETFGWLGPDEGEIATFLADYDDDPLEKLIRIPIDPSERSRATLWMLGRSYVWEGDFLREDPLYAVMVNDDPAQVVRFHPGLLFGFQVSESDGDLQHRQPEWQPVDIPIAWLRREDNTFLIYKDIQYQPRKREPTVDQQWTHNNLSFGIARTRDDDHSWWYDPRRSEGEGLDDVLFIEKRQGEAEAWRRANVPPDFQGKWERALEQDPQRLDAARAAARRDCRGELMIFLELDGAR